jgi:pimeloyl-ACP methyl ester carboxylesterase
MVLVYLLIGFAILICLSLALSTVITRRHLQKVFSSPQVYGLPFEDIHFTTGDNLQLHGWWIPSEKSSRTIIFLHGFNGSMDPDLKYASRFVRDGFNVLMFDFRNHGRSEGKTTSLGAGEVLDAEAAIHYARTRGSEKIGLFGFSMGGRVALLTAARDNKIAAIVSDGGPVRFSTAIIKGLKNKGIPRGIRQVFTLMIQFGASFRSGNNLFTNDPVRIKPGQLIVPTLLIHGENDPFTTLKDLQQMVSLIGAKADLWVVSGVGHRETDELDPETYLKKIIAFFNTWM